jgi:tripartite-type tricarboxylate transporter receptor subunit TctC
MAEGEIVTFEKDVVLVVPFNPGAAADTYAHMIKAVGEKYLGHTMLLEYKPGGTGIVGMNYMLTKPHDGYTICILGNNIENSVATGQASTFDEFDYIALGNPGGEQSVISVPANSPFKTLNDIIEFARQNPGKLNWGGAGSLSYNHFFALQTMQYADVKFNYSPYDNGGETTLAILSGNVDIGTTPTVNILPYHKSGEVRIIAQGLPQRHATLLDIPTVYETPSLEYEKYGTPLVSTRAILAPANIPEPIRKAWDNILGQILRDSEWEAWAKQSEVLTEIYMNSAECTESMRANTARIRKIFEKLDLGE